MSNIEYASTDNETIFITGTSIEPAETIKIKYKPGAHKLEKTARGDWIDMYTYEDITLKKGDFRILDLGVAMELPEGYEGHLCPRSSTFKNWKLIQANHMGIFDHSYCGNNDIWGMPVYAFEDVVIPKDTRLCQFRIVKQQPTINFIEVDDLGNPDRDGWGSSGL